MPKASWQGAVLAESDRTVVVEGNHYFPPESIRREHFRPSDTHSVCPWKGTASYHHLEVNGLRNPDAAWYYPEPKEAARAIKGHVAFWKGVRVEPQATLLLIPGGADILACRERGEGLPRCLSLVLIAFTP